MTDIMRLCRRRHRRPRRHRRSIRMEIIVQLQGIGTYDEASNTFAIRSLGRFEAALHCVAYRSGHLVASNIWKGRATHPDVR